MLNASDVMQGLGAPSGYFYAFEVRWLSVSCVEKIPIIVYLILSPAPPALLWFFLGDKKERLIIVFEFTVGAYLGSYIAPMNSIITVSPSALPLWLHVF